MSVTLCHADRVPVSFLQIGARRVHVVRVRGGNKKYRALRLDHGNFAWASEGEHLFRDSHAECDMMTNNSLTECYVDYYSALMHCLSSSCEQYLNANSHFPLLYPLNSGVARKTRIVDVVYNASNNELVRTKTLVKNCIILVDATPFRRWYENHYAQLLGKKKNQKLTAEEEQILNKKKSKSVEKKYKARQKVAKLEPSLEEQMQAGRVLGE